MAFVYNNALSLSDNLNNLATLLASTKPIPIKYLRFKDLMFPAGECHGIYAFCEGNNYHLRDLTSPQTSNPPYWYIGKASGKSIAERIAAHLGPHPTDYGNTLIRHMAEALYGSSNETTIAKVLPIIQDLSLKIVIFKEVPNGCQKHYIIDLEKELIKRFQPAFNWTRRMKRKF